jgi:hypothetical protein
MLFPSALFDTASGEVVPLFLDWLTPGEDHTTAVLRWELAIGYGEIRFGAGSKSG